MKKLKSVAVFRTVFVLCCMLGAVSVITVIYWLECPFSKTNSDIHRRMKITIPEKESTYSEFKRRKALVIVTRHRSGSSFLGQYFNQRNDSFYMYEPLLPFNHICPPGTNESLQVEYLRRLFSCKVEDQQEFFKRIGAPFDSQTLSMNCLPQNMCFRKRMKAVCTKEFCQMGDASTCTGCEPVNTTLASHKCGLANIVVIKVIRICNIENLRPLLEDPSLDVKVLELIRDPRGQYNSKEKVKALHLMRNVESACHSITNNWKKALKKENKWIGNKYKLIRYEDICRHPLELGRQIYRFVGLDMTPEMENWIKANTKGHTAHARLAGRKTSSDIDAIKQLGARKTGEQRLPAGGVDKKSVFVERTKSKDSNLQQLDDNAYSTMRDSNANWRKWTWQLNFDKVASVQKMCLDMMTTFKYVPIKDKDQLGKSSTIVLNDFCHHNTFSFNQSFGC